MLTTLSNVDYNFLTVNENKNFKFAFSETKTSPHLDVFQIIL